MLTITEVTKKDKVYIVKINHDIIELDPEVVLKYRLTSMMDLDEKTFQSLKNDQAYIHYRKLGLKKLSKMMTTYEMKVFLMNQECKESMIKQIIKDFESKNYLNDKSYVKNYVELKKYSYGPHLMTYKLLEKGIDRQMVEEMLEKLDEFQILNELILKKVNTLKHTSHRQMKLKIKSTFVQKGFNLEVIDHVIEKSIHWSNIKEEDAIKHEFLKLLKQYQRKFEGKELIKKITEKLYQKGYQNTDIHEVLKEIDALQIN